MVQLGRIIGRLERSPMAGTHVPSLCATPDRVMAKSYFPVYSVGLSISTKSSTRPSQNCRVKAGRGSRGRNNFFFSRTTT
ncbi:MAG: hypothetical protein ACFB02_08665 [Mastigocoleus sp.]